MAANAENRRLKFKTGKKSFLQGAFLSLDNQTGISEFYHKEAFEQAGKKIGLRLRNSLACLQPDLRISREYLCHSSTGY